MENLLFKQIWHNFIEVFFSKVDRDQCTCFLTPHFSTVLNLRKIIVIEINPCQKYISNKIVLLKTNSSFPPPYINIVPHSILVPNEKGMDFYAGGKTAWIWEHQEQLSAQLMQQSGWWEIILPCSPYNV